MRMVIRRMKNENLLPCPFCGADAVMSGYSRQNGGEDWYVGCSRDECVEFDTKFKCIADAENAWNTRAEKPILDKHKAESEKE